MNPPHKSGWRGQRGGTGARILVVFFLIGVVVLFLLARSCYKAVSSFGKSFSSSKSSSSPAKPMAKSLPCPAIDPALAASLLKGEAASVIPCTGEANLPTDLGKIWGAQEKLWVQAALLEVVDKVNKSAIRAAA